MRAIGLTCLFVLTAGIQASAQQIDRTQTFLRVNEVKKMTFQYHKQKPKKPETNYAGYKHQGGFYDLAAWQRDARWQRKLRMRKTCTGTLREVEKVHIIEGEGTVVTVVRGKYLEKYWVAPFRSKILKGLGAGDSRTQAIEKLGRPYRRTGSVLAYACLDFSVGLGGDFETYSECLRVYFKGGAVIAAKYFLLRDCEAAPFMKDAFFTQAEVLKKIDAAFNRATLPREKGFRKYPSFAFSVQFKDDKPKAKRKVGTVEICEGPKPVFESLYSLRGGKSAVILKSGKKEEVYWVGRFISNKLKGVAAGDSRRTVIRKLGVPFQRTSYALAYACKDWAAAEYDQKTVYKTCLKIFFKKGKAIGAYYSHKVGC
ncbi:MAG: hypothetical protein V3S64_12025 [bacterium]